MNDRYLEEINEHSNDEDIIPISVEYITDNLFDEDIITIFDLFKRPLPANLFDNNIIFRGSVDFENINKNGVKINE